MDKFPRISKLKNSELPDEEEIINTLFAKLDTNYDEVQVKIREIKQKYIEDLPLAEKAFKASIIYLIIAVYLLQTLEQ